jgi:hypothetical protein
MVSATKVYVRTGIVGTWAVLLGGTIVVGIDRALGMLPQNGSSSVSISAAGFPILALAESALLNVYQGSAVGILLGVLLLLGGWYELLRLSTSRVA